MPQAAASPPRGDPVGGFGASSGRAARTPPEAARIQAEPLCERDRVVADLVCYTIVN